MTKTPLSSEHTRFKVQPIRPGVKYTTRYCKREQAALDKAQAIIDDPPIGLVPNHVEVYRTDDPPSPYHPRKSPKWRLIKTLRVSE